MENYGKMWGGQRGGSVSASASRELLYLHATCLGGRALGRRPSDASAAGPAAWGTAGSSARVMEVLCSRPPTSSLGCSVGRGTPLAARWGRQRHTWEVTEHTWEVTEQAEGHVLRE